MTHIKLNLGVTTLIAYASALTNGGCNYNFKSEILQKHAEWERNRPVKPILDSLFEGRHFYLLILKVIWDNNEWIFNLADKILIEDLFLPGVILHILFISRKRIVLLCDCSKNI